MPAPSLWLHALVAGALLCSVPGGAAAAGVHPRLVSGETTTCTGCHEDLFRGRGEAHAPARKACTVCHRVTSDGTATTIGLVEKEPALCLGCHKEMAAWLGRGSGPPTHPVIESCLACHDPHASTHRPLLLASPASLCGNCHDRDALNARHGGQLTPATDCVRCHEPHGSANPHLLRADHLHAPFADGSCQACHRAPLGDRVRLRARGERLCTACHGNHAGAAPKGGSVHAALRGEGGRAGCLHCHDPHMSRRAALTTEGGPELCGACHRDLLERARGEGGHPVAAEDCLVCHDAHEAEQPHLLKEPPGNLCRGCHDPADRALAAAHLGADPGSLVCTNCHSPHGSGNPHLLARHLHPPVLEGCDTCHEGRFDRLVDGGGSALCLECHADIGERAADSAVPHPALEVARCADCHNPHASKQEHLVKGPAGEVCLSCHDDQAPAEGETAHGVIQWIGCQACHEPHGGERANLLRLEAPELCLSCHEPSRVRADGPGATVRLLGRFDVPAAKLREMATLRLSADGQRDHPVPNHRVLGTPTKDELKRNQTTYQGELTCLTCHDPHKGRSGALLRWNAAGPMEACAHCHKK